MLRLKKKLLLLVLFGVFLLVQLGLYLSNHSNREPGRPKAYHRRGRRLPTAPDKVQTERTRAETRKIQIRYHNDSDLGPDCPAPPPDKTLPHSLRRPRVYVHDLPAEFNLDILQCLRRRDPKNKCYTVDHCGHGRPVLQGSGLNVHQTWQFALERIIHARMIAATGHRVQHVKHADVVYVPYYAGLDCICHQGDSSPQPVRDRIQRLLEFLSNNSYDKPLVMTIGKIEREMATVRCPLLTYRELQNVIFIGLEAETSESFRRQKRHGAGDLIIAPYPSYGHLDPSAAAVDYVDTLHSDPRPVRVFLAASTRRSNHDRAKILDQFRHRVHQAPPGNRSAAVATEVWLVTPECSGNHHSFTVDWMQRSVFCLQPPGDSPTRKSFYDALVSGCIPVIFSDDRQTRFPFDGRLDYDSFTVTLDWTQARNVSKALRAIRSDTVDRLQQGLRAVLPWLQYTYPVVTGSQTDAVKLIMDELSGRILHDARHLQVP